MEQFIGKELHQVAQALQQRARHNLYQPVELIISDQDRQQDAGAPKVRQLLQSIHYLEMFLYLVVEPNAAVDERHLRRRAAEPHRRVEAPEAPPDDDHAHRAHVNSGALPPVPRA